MSVEFVTKPFPGFTALNAGVDIVMSGMAITASVLDAFS
jgi:hypothetical protein